MTYLTRILSATDGDLGVVFPPIRLAIGVGFMGEDFSVVGDVKDAVILAPGFHQYGALRGHCIWKAGTQQCWQVNPKHPGEITYWNADGKAEGHPQDWELFTFAPAGADGDRVQIKTVYNSYVQLKGGRFVTGANASVASIFTLIEPG